LPNSDRILSVERLLLSLKLQVQPEAGTWLAGACALAFVLLAVRHVDAAIVVDPLSAGATDVGFTYHVPGNLLTNPVADPLNSPPGGGGNGLLIVGNTTNGSLLINGGSQATVFQLWMARNAGTRGVITVTGAGSKLSSEIEIRVGLSSSTATLEILDGGVVETGQVYVSSDTVGVPAEVVVSGVASRLSLDYGLYILGTKQTTVRTSNGATLEARDVSIGNYSLSSSLVNEAIVESNSKWIVTSDLEVGNSGSGKLTISSGGVVEAYRTTLYDSYNSGAASLALNGGTLRTKELYMPAGQISGSGTVQTNGLVADLDLTVDAAHGITQTVPIPGQPGVSLELDLSAPYSLGAGYRGDGSLRIADGRQVESFSGYLGYNSSSHGTASVTGAGSKWSLTGDLAVGHHGVGVLNIGSGATVDVAGLLQINQPINGESSYVMLNGGELLVNVLAAVPNQIRGQGTVRANGVHFDSSLVFDQPGVFVGGLPIPGEQVTIEFNQPVMSVLGAGLHGNGTIEIRNGAEVRSDEGLLGKEFDSHGTAIVEGAGSKWQLQSGELKIGGTTDNAQGTLRVLNGGAVEAGLVHLSNDSEVEVAGNGAVLDSTSLRIERYGEVSVPRIHVHSGGVASFLDLQTVGSNGLTGQITVEDAGSRLKFAYYANFNGALLRVRDGGLLELGNSSQPGQSTLDLQGATMHLDGGTVDVHGGQVDLEGGQLLFESGMLRDFSRFDGNLWQTAGSVELGEEVTVIDGTYYQDEDATLSMVLSSNPDPRLFIKDSAILKGTLKVGLPNTPQSMPFQLGDEFEMIYAQHGVSGEFQSYELPELPAGMSWSLSQFHRGLSLVIVAGDFNADGQVDAADYTVWQDSLDMQVPQGSGADADGNGWISMNDYEIWKEFFGRKVLAPSANIAGQVANSLSVPEPASIFVLLSGLLAAAFTYRRR
jgi:T5SS/PEP-CTERM-associated repeat protein